LGDASWVAGRDKSFLLPAESVFPGVMKKVMNSSLEMAPCFLLKWIFLILPLNF